jgi:HEAT repeat protein
MSKRWVIPILIFVALVLAVLLWIVDNPHKQGLQAHWPRGWELSPLALNVKAYLAAHPEDAHRHIGMVCGNGEEASLSGARAIMFGAPPGALFPLLEHRSPYIRAAVLDSFRRMGPFGHYPVQAGYRFGNARIKLELMPLAEPNAPDSKKIELLKEIIADPDQPVFFEDTSLVTQQIYGGANIPAGNYPVDIVRFFTRLMKESDFSVDQGYAALTLGGFGPDAASAVPALVEILQSDYVPEDYWWGFPRIGVVSDSVPGDAAIALGGIGPAASDAVPALLEIKEKGGEVSYCAASSLYLIGYEKENNVQFLENELERESSNVTIYPSFDALSGASQDVMFNTEGQEHNTAKVADHLGRIGPDARDALPRLIELTRDGSRELRQSARQAIAGIVGKPDMEIGILADMLESNAPDIRDEAIQALSWMRSDDISLAVPALVDALSKPGDNQYMLIDLLLFIGGHEDEIISAVNEDIKNRTDQFEQLATLVSTRIGPRANALLPAVKGLIEGDPKDVSNGVFVYMHIGGDTDWLVPKLIEWTRSETTSTNVVDVAIWGLRDIGPDASAALPRLREIAQSGDERRRSFAQEAIAAIEGG